MDLKKEKINIILIATSIVLFFTYILSFTNFSSTDKRKLVKTALVNNKYLDSINRFELSQGEQKITLSKEKAGGGDVWFILAENNTKILPADKELINNFIIKLTKVINMYKISDKISQNNSFGLTDSSTFCLKYYFSDSEFQQIYFGNLDFSNSFRYLMSGKTTTVYQVENTIDTFLNTKIQFWAEPNIISKQIINISPDSIQKITLSKNSKTKSFSSQQKNFREKCFDLLELRHGGIPTPEEFQSINNQNPSKIFIENGNKSTVELSLFNLDTDSKINNSVIIKTEYIFENSKNQTYSKISNWTYKKILEILEVESE